MKVYKNVNTYEIEITGMAVYVSKNDEKYDKGNIVLQGGSLAINAAHDGIDAVNQLVVLDGKYDITAGGGSPETIQSEGDFGGMPGGMPPTRGGNARATSCRINRRKCTNGTTKPGTNARAIFRRFNGACRRTN